MTGLPSVLRIDVQIFLTCSYRSPVARGETPVPYKKDEGARGKF